MWIWGDMYSGGRFQQEMVFDVFMRWHVFITEGMSTWDAGLRSHLWPAWMGLDVPSTLKNMCKFTL